MYNPEISEAFTVAPEVVYSPIVPLSFVTNRFPPDTAMPSGYAKPEISEAFTVAPEVVYSPIVPPCVRDKQIPSRHRDAIRVSQPRDQRGVHRRPRGGVFANRADGKVRDKQIISRHRDGTREIQPRDQRGVHCRPRRGVFANRAGFSEGITDSDNRFPPDTAMPLGILNPEISAAFTVAPEVVYSPIVPVWPPPSAGCSFATKICPRAVAGMAQIAAAPRRSVKRADGSVARVMFVFMVLL